MEPCQPGAFLSLPERLLTALNAQCGSSHYHPGWYVYINGHLLPIEGADYQVSSEGLMLHRPLCKGDVLTLAAPLLDERWTYCECCEDQDGWVRM